MHGKLRNIVATLAGTLLLMSLFLQGCSTPQVTKSADLLFKEGEEYFRNGKYEDAIAQWKKVKETYQSQELSTKAELGIADAYFLNKDYIEAAVGYEDFRKLHPKHLQADYALYRQGLSSFNQIHSIDTDQTPVTNSLTAFESYLVLYPAGAHRAEVLEKRRECRDKQLQYELYVGRFYYRTDAYKAAISRLEQSLKMFSDAAGRDEVLYYLGKAYLDDGQKEKGRAMFEQLVHDFPASTFIVDADKFLKSSTKGQ
ncbi:MAG: outer membrane protein assembly factor BamD [Desulfuromonadaceae bacterium]|nr:outer membrane protein assembly factor BamD [Desulfuromonadaceae bacterium]MDD5104735.1 outer membrane protein assembly factor BamD [Desulfuromonadaceae bacterium]